MPYKGSRKDMKNCIKKLRRIVYYLINYPTICLHRVQVAENCGFCGLLYIKTTAKKTSIIIGEGTNINSSMRANPIGGHSRTILYTRGEGKICIGKRVGISNTAIVSTASVTIGDDTNIGGGTVIYDTDFHSINAEDRLNGDCRVKSAPVVIGSRVFIGGHCIILKGSTIGDNAVIGAGSVVSGNIPANEIWAGNPARMIKKIV